MKDKKKMGNLLYNKKGIGLLGGHTINIVIAVIVLMVLIYLGVRVGGMFMDKSNLEKAENNLNSFITDFENFMNGEEDKDNLMILGPKKWWILFFHESKNNPNICEFGESEYCVCICNGDEVKNCNERGQGVCFELKYEWKGENKYKLNEVPFNMGVSK